MHVFPCAYVFPTLPRESARFPPGFLSWLCLLGALSGWGAAEIIGLTYLTPLPQRPLSFITCCVLENGVFFVFCLVWFWFGRFGWEGKSNPCYFIFAVNRCFSTYTLCLSDYENYFPLSFLCHRTLLL